MADKPQQPARDGRTQTTPKGLEIPLPKRKDVMAAFRKIVGGGLICHVCGEPIRDTNFVKATVTVDGKRAPAAIHEACIKKP